ncbi:DUF397 domain-containing protein [Streptomyces sp. NPDC088725]|uniref:DUF397 domain-containing protein n=1 Tax=Streptomyces sp. NPDC088725 TaxID=3365873 RepID=UPI00381D78C1
MALADGSVTICAAASHGSPHAPRCAVVGSHSSNDGPACVEVAAVSGALRVRDSKNVPGPQLGFASDAWAAFVPYGSES